MEEINSREREPERMRRIAHANSNYRLFAPQYDEEVRHAKIVAILAYDTARKLGMSENECLKAFECGLEHDIGKGGLPPSVLFSTEKYPPSENPIRGLHVDLGASYAIQEGLPEHVVHGIKYHHETFKGHPTSYPGELKGTNIPLCARIIAPADNFAAISRDRIYRKALTFKETERIMMTYDYFKFDPEILAKFLELCYDFHKQEKNLLDVVAGYYIQRKERLIGQKL